jgi:hypothetical protein
VGLSARAPEEAVLSDKDSQLPKLADIEPPFQFEQT